MAERPRSRRSPTRFLAPLALAATVAGVYLVAHHALDGGSHHVSRHAARRSAGHRRPATVQQKTTTTPASSSPSDFYTVKAGDNLSTISARTGVPLPQLESLNPKVSSTSLQVGQRLRLRR
jgi:LysM repeat protein